MGKQRNKIFSYDSLSFIGKISLLISISTIQSKLKKGSWLDILSGYKALIQLSQRRNSKISSFYALDHRLDPKLSKIGFYLKEIYIDRTLPYKQNMFDNITITNGLEHLKNPFAVINECYRILKHGEILQIIVPTWFSKPFLEFIAFKLHNKQADIEVNDHKMYYDEKILWPILVKSRFCPKNISMKRIKFFMSLYAIAIKD